jgi:methylated-DNA-protein-cysteine methyltransferase related protein
VILLEERIFMMWSPPNPREYNAQVWQIVRQIPSGRVMSYGQIAALLPTPEGIDDETYRRLGPRWVGAAMRAVKGVQIPWWRVLNAAGQISLPAGSASALEQRQRLEDEGVVFDAKERLDFAVVGWEPDDTRGE